MLVTQPTLPTLKAVDVRLIGFTMDQLTRFCVYEAWAGDDLVFIGCNTMTHSVVLSEMQRCKEWANYPNDQEWSIVIKYTGAKVECNNQRGRMLRDLPQMPIFNRMMSLRPSHKTIMCNEDGRTYPSQAATAAAYGLNQGNLSKHLRGTHGINSVGGRTFQFVPHGKDLVIRKDKGDGPTGA